MRKKGGTTCLSRRGELRRYRRELTSIYNLSDNTQLRLFIKGELDTLKMLIADASFCPTKEYINSYKTTTDATISELT
jgi:hypothetical protein